MRIFEYFEFYAKINLDTAENKLPNGTWYAYVPDWALTNDTRGGQSEAIVSHGNTEGHTCASNGALLKQCTQVSTELPPSAVRCVPANTTIELTTPAVPFSSMYWIVTPKQPLLQLPLQRGIHEQGQVAPSTRAGLVRALDTVLSGSGSGGEVIKQPVPDPSAPVTLAELQEVVIRHAAVWRSAELQLDLRGFMGLEAFVFPG